MTNYSLPNTHYPLVTIVGPTSSGKSELAVFLAKKFNGEIISVDSRQIYKGMDLGTGKVAGKWLASKKRTYAKVRKNPPSYFYKGIRHYLIDYVSPTRQYSVARFQRDAKKAIANILKQGKLPILCGGTAHWIDAIVFEQNIPEVKPNKKLRESLEKKSVEELYEQLQKLDPVRATTIDQQNPRRLIRALEIVMTTGKPVPPLISIPSAAEESVNLKKIDPSTPRVHSSVGMTQHQTLWLGIKTDQDELYKKIEKRLKQRFKQGMIKEVERLHKGTLPLFSKEGARGSSKIGLSWKKLEGFGLEYKFIAQYLQQKITYEEMFTQLLFAIKHYSKRQLTWWKRNKEINWFNVNDKQKILIATKKLINSYEKK